MGNNVNKVIRVDDDYEVSLSLKIQKLNKRKQQQHYHYQPEDEQGEEEEVHLVVEDGSNGAPDTPTTNTTTPKVGKKRGRPRKIPENEETGSKPRSEKRGRPSTCATFGSAENPSLNIKVLKSHLAPFYTMIVPMDFAKNHMQENCEYEIVNGNKCKALRVEKASTIHSYRFNRDQWVELVEEHDLHVGDSVHLQLLGQAQIRIDVFKATEPAPANGGATPVAALPVATANVILLNNTPTSAEPTKTGVQKPSVSI